MNARQKKRGAKRVRTISDSKAELLVVDWANTATEYPNVTETTPRPFSPAMQATIRDTDAAIGRLVRKYPEVFSSFRAGPPPPEDRESSVATDHWWIVAKVQQYLRLAWDTSDLREKEWHLFKARDSFHYSTVFQPLFDEKLRKAPTGTNPFDEPLTPEEDAARLSVPAFTPLEQALYHLQRIAKRMRHCLNPECPAPYFLAKKKGQKYCTAKCSAPMQRQQKRDWWRENRAKRPN